MIYTQAEMEVLALCAWCKDLPTVKCSNLPAEIVNLFLEQGLIKQTRNGLSYRVSPDGYELLRTNGFNYSDANLFRSKYDIIRRRLQTAEITSFFWRYGTNVFLETPPAENKTDVFLPSFALRRQKHANILGGSKLSGFYYTKETVFIPYYIDKDNNGIYPNVEQRTFRAETLACGKRPYIIYTGNDNLQKIIDSVSYKKEKSNKSTTVYYKDAIDKFDCPLAIMPLTADGMRQLRILSSPDYRQRLARNILGNNYLPPKTSQSDGRTKTENIIIGIDCNISRFENAVKSKKITKIFVLPFQAEAVQKIVSGSKVKCYVLNLKETEDFFELPPTLPGIDNTPFQTEKGEYAYVPPFRKGKKT